MRNGDPIAPPHIDARSWTLLLVLSLLWSVSFIFIKVGVVEIPILTLLLIRVGLAALVLDMIVLARRPRPVFNRPLLVRYALMACFNNIFPGLLIIYATARIGAGAASILNATAPIFAILIAHVATADEKLNAAKLTGTFVGMAGVAAMTGPYALAGVAGETIAVAAMLLATFCYGLAAVLGRTFAGIDPVVSAASQLTLSTLLLAPITLLLDPAWSAFAPSRTAIMAGVCLALVSTALAYVLFFQLLARAGAINAILVTLLIPVSGVVLAWLLLGEPVTLQKVGGMALIGLGLLAIDGRAWNRLPGRRIYLKPR